MKCLSLCSLMFFLSLNLVQAQQKKFHVVGYYAAWAGEPEDIQFSKLTQVNYAFALPNSDGSIRSIVEMQKLSYLVELAHEQNVKVFLAIGGWDLGDGGGNDEAFEVLASKEESRKRFASSLMEIVEKYDLDGIDIDWEYPDAGTSGENFTLTMKELYTVLHANKKELSAAVAGHGEHGEGVTTDAFQYMDFLNIMSYDGPAPHASMEFTTECLNYWLKKGCPKEKVILGLPFYGRDPFTGYKTLMEKDPAAPFQDQIGDIHYNGIETIKKKTLMAKEKVAGVMIWELTMDVNSKYSLLKAIQDALKGK